MIFDGLYNVDNKLRNSFMFAISFNSFAHTKITFVHRKCVITEPKPSISENKEIKNIK